MYVVSPPTIDFTLAPVANAFSSSGGLVEQHWVLTCFHVGSGNGMYIEGELYDVLEEVQLPNVDLGQGYGFSDLKLVRVRQPLRTWSILNYHKPAVGAALLAGGYGLGHKAGYEHVPFTIPTESSHIGLTYGTAVCTDEEGVFGAGPGHPDYDQPYEDMNVVWVIKALDKGGLNTEGWLGKNDSGCPIFQKIGDEYRLVAVGNQTNAGLYFGDPPGVVDYQKDPFNRDVDSVSYSGGFALGTGTSYPPMGYASVEDWIKSVIYRDRLPFFRNSFYDGFFHTTPTYRTSQNQISLSQTSPANSLLLYA